MRLTMTYEIAMAAAKGTGDRHMRAGGRMAWNIDDYRAAAAEFNRLFPE